MPQGQDQASTADRKEPGCTGANPGALSPTVCPAAHTATWGAVLTEEGPLAL